MSELKPCPFCGKDDGLYSIPRLLEITKEETKEIEWAVGCKRCDVHLYRVRYAKENGFATWNTRPIEDALLARAEKAEDIIHGMFPLWVAAMSYAEHGRAADLDRIRNYYNGRDNPLTGEQLHYLFSMEDKE